MKRRHQTENGPGLLADYLAELLKQFRHFSDPMEPAPGVASQLARIKISARLLSLLGGPTPADGAGFSHLGGVLGEWVTFFESSPESFPVHLIFAFERLADFLEELLGHRDRGVSRAELAGDRGWPAVQAAFSHAGTPLAVLEEVDSLFGKWESRWSEDNLTPVQVGQLQSRWDSLRARGDDMFRCLGDAAAGRGASREETSGPWTVMLLVDSSFRRDQIVDKLSERGWQVSVPGDPEEALKLLTIGPAPMAVLCDQLEPTRHLVRLREGLAGLADDQWPPLVLVEGHSPHGSREPGRAPRLGVAALWTEPFDPSDLDRILQRLSQA